MRGRGNLDKGSGKLNKPPRDEQNGQHTELIQTSLQEVWSPSADGGIQVLLAIGHAPFVLSESPPHQPGNSERTNDN